MDMRVQGIRKPGIDVARFIGRSGCGSHPGRWKYPEWR